MRHASRAAALRELSNALWLAGDVDAAEPTLTEAIDAARAASDTRLEWYARLDRAARNATVKGDTAGLETVAARAIEVFAELGDDLGLARAWRRLGLAAHMEQRFAAAAEAFERSLERAVAAGDERERARSADALCTAWLFGPAHVDDVVRRAEELGASAQANVFLQANVSASLAALAAMQGDFDRAHRLADDAGHVYTELGQRLPWVGWKMMVAWVEQLSGDTGAAIEALRESYEVLEAGGYDSHRGFYAALLAFLLAGEGRVEEARTYLDASRHDEDALDGAALARLRAAQALVTADPAGALAAARDAVALAHESDDLNLQAEMHEVLARVGGDPGELAEARRLYEQKGNRTAAAALALAAR